MFFLTVPNLTQVPDARVIAVPYPWNSSALYRIPKIVLLEIAEPTIKYVRQASSVPEGESYTIVIDNGPPFDSSFSPRERAARDASIFSPFASVTAALNAAAYSACPDHVKENECFHNNVKGSGTVRVAPGPEPFKGFRLVETSNTITIGSKAFPLYKQEGPQAMAEGSIGVWVYGTLRSSRLRRGSYELTSSKGNIVSRDSISSRWDEWTSYYDGDHPRRIGRCFGGWGGDFCSDSAFSVSQVDYDGGWGDYGGGDKYFYGGFTKSRLKGDLFPVSTALSYSRKFVWLCTLTVQVWKYGYDGAVSLYSNTVTPLTLFSYGYTVHDPSVTGFIDLGRSFWELKAREAEGLARIVQSWAPAPRYGLLVQQAVDSEVKVLSSNNIENLLQLRKLSGFLPIESLKLLWSGSKAKSLASLYLWYRYVYLPTRKDFGEFAALDQKVMELIEPGNRSVRKGTTSTFSALDIDVEIRDGAKVVFSVHDTEHAAYNPYFYGLHVGTAQAWDLVPFSFVADWFLGIGPILGQLDFLLYRNLFALKYVLTSRKMSSRVDLSTLGPISGQMQVTSYVRGASVSWPSPDVGFVGRSVSQWWAAGLSLAVLLKDS